MNYVYVATGDNNNPDMDLAITSQTGYALYSLIDGLRQADFGLHTIEGAASSIRRFAGSFVTPVGGKIMTDSGGYSFIKGDIPPSKLEMLCDCHTVYLEEEVDQYDYIFTLDLPLSLRFENFNNVDNIYNANKLTINNAIKALKKNDKMQDKLYMVWHFKIMQQFEIWKTISKELEIGMHFKNHAIGGMVGIKKASKISHSPFIGISYYILRHHFESRFAGDDFRMHYLGIYAPYDRFQISLLESLFCKYLKVHNSSVSMTYDSINPIHTARMNKNCLIYKINGTELDSYNSVMSVPNKVIYEISSCERHAFSILNDVERRRNGKMLNNAASFSPLHVFSNLQIDLYFQNIINQYEVADIIMKSSSFLKVKGMMHRIFSDLAKKYPALFTRHFLTCAMENIELTFQWHREYLRSEKAEDFDYPMRKEINAIDFPYRLR